MADFKIPTKKRYGALLTEAMRLTRLTQHEIAGPCNVVVRTVARWLNGQTLPTSIQQRVIVQILHETGRVPVAILEEMAWSSIDTLESLGLVPASAPPAAVPGNAQQTVDAAVREAAEALDVPPRALRPVAARLFEAIAQGGVPADVAARLAVTTKAKGP